MRLHDILSDNLSVRISLPVLKPPSLPSQYPNNLPRLALSYERSPCRTARHLLLHAVGNAYVDPPSADGPVAASALLTAILIASKEWVIPAKPKPGRKPKKDPPPSTTCDDPEVSHASPPAALWC